MVGAEADYWRPDVRYLKLSFSYSTMAFTKHRLYLFDPLSVQPKFGRHSTYVGLQVIVFNTRNERNLNIHRNSPRIFNVVKICTERGNTKFANGVLPYKIHIHKNYPTILKWRLNATPPERWSSKSHWIQKLPLSWIQQTHNLKEEKSNIQRYLKKF